MKIVIAAIAAMMVAGAAHAQYMPGSTFEPNTAYTVQPQIGGGFAVQTYNPPPVYTRPTLPSYMPQQQYLPDQYNGFNR